MEESRKASEIYERLADDNPTVPLFQVGVATSRSGAGYLLYQQGKRPEALEEFDKALAIIQKLAKAHPKVPTYQSDLVALPEQHRSSPGKDGADHGRLGRVSRKRHNLAMKLAADHPEFPYYQSLAVMTAVDVGVLKADHGDPTTGLKLCRECAGPTDRNESQRTG